jgi:hypothetical protein
VSGLFKSIGKIFKKVAKFVIKIAPYALAAAAVVFTGGAALGILPAFSTVVGGLVGGLGLSAGLTGALTGAITSAGFGAALGFVTGGEKGLKKGALMGALTGGVLGAMNPATFGIGQGASGAATTSAAQAANNGIAPVSADLLNPQPLSSLANTPSFESIIGQMPTLDPTAGVSAIQQTAQQLGQAASAASDVSVQAAGQGIAPLAQAAPAPTAPAVDTSSFLTPASTQPVVQATKSGDFISNLLGGTGGVGGNPSLIGSVLSALGGGDDGGNSAKDEEKAREKMGKFAYGGVYAGKENPFGIPSEPFAIPQPRFYYDKATNTVVDRQQPQGA